VTARQQWGVLVVMICLCGCSADSSGTEAAARKHFDTEFKKWMAGQENSAATMTSKVRGLLDPISYDVRSVVTDEPHFAAYKEGATLPEDWKTWPAFRFNVAIEWKSKAGTPLTDVTTYTLSWNASEKRWYVAERF
jgi:hypothetical protein